MFELLRQIGSNIPLYGIWIFGIIVAWDARRFHRRSATLALTGLAILLISSLSLGLINVYLLTNTGWFAGELPTNYATLGQIFAILSAVNVAVQFIGWLLIVWALNSVWKELRLFDVKMGGTD